MQKVEITSNVAFGETIIDEITVRPLAFFELAAIWASVGTATKDFSKLIQRGRIAKQTVFKAKGKVVPMLQEHLTVLPIGVAKAIIAALDADEGKAGTVVTEGDGVTKPIVYQLGTPLKMKNGKGDDVDIVELEFLAKTFGEVEDVLAAANDVERALILIRDLAVPLGGSGLQRLPAALADKITTADGVCIVQHVAKHF